MDSSSPKRVVLLLALACPWGASAQPIGIIQRVTGHCFLKAKMDSERPATPETPVLEGHSFRCEAGGKLELELRTAWGSHTVLDGKGEWWTPTRVNGQPPKSRDTMSKPLDQWFKLAGAPRGGFQTWVYSPPGGSEDGAVWPAQFVFRWLPPDTAGNISLAIRDENGRKLWPPGAEKAFRTPGATGQLLIPVVRDALLQYRNDGGHGRLTLVLTNPEDDESSVKFSVISMADEDSLQRHLEDCEGETGLLRAVCRAYYFSELHLYTEAADEYESALRDIAPESSDLIRHAIVAHGMTSNVKREKELTKLLADREKVPQ